jgi:hypothetical protein
MAPEESFWYRVGYALERGRRPSAPREWKRLAGLAERAWRAHPQKSTPEGFAVEQLLSRGVAALAGRLLDVWRPRRRAGLMRLMWAGASGAAAALILETVRPLLRGEPELLAFDRDTGDRILAGLGQGLLYGAVIEPRIPGPSVLKGALFGSAEYAADAAGGLVRVLGAHAPQRRLPLVGRMLEEIDPRDRVYLEHLAFGIALAVLYGSSVPSNGIVSEGDGDDEE